MDYQNLTEDLKKIIMPILEGEGVELVELNLIRAGRRPILKLLVDKREIGINVKECADLNRKIGIIIDNQGLITDGYILEVSSPGLDRPLKTKGDFLRCINKNVKFFFLEPVNEKRELDGCIVSADDLEVCVNVNSQEIKVPYSKISKAKQIIDDI